MAKKKNYSVAKSSGKRKAKAIPQKVTDDIVRRKGAQYRKQFPEKYPFWARLKIGKKRTTLVIDDEVIPDKDNPKKRVNGFVHREATHVEHKDFEKIEPNPDRTDDKPMYLKRPRKAPQVLFKPHNKQLDMPDALKKRYDQSNNRKKR